MSTSAILNTQYSLNSFKIRVRAFNAAGWGEYSTISSSGTGVWSSGGTAVAHPDACTTAPCTCVAPDCSGGCGSCAACDGGCGGCGTRSVTGSVGTRTATAGTSTLTASNTNTRTCYRWTRSGSTSSGYIYNQNSTDACSSAYTGCVGRTCSACTAGSCSGCSAGTCGCSGCSGSWSSYYDFVTVAISGGTYPYATGTIWGWAYSDSAGNAIYTCAGGSGLLGPANVDSCNLGGYRATGGDVCIFPSCC